MVPITVIENEVQTLVTFDVGIIACFRVVMSVSVHIDKRREVGCVVALTVGGPSQDVIGDLITRFAVVNNEKVDFFTGQIPDMIILHQDHHVDGGLGRREWSRPVVLADLAISESRQVEVLVGIETAKPQCMLENSLFAATSGHFPCRAVAGVDNGKFRKARAIA